MNRIRGALALPLIAAGAAACVVGLLTAGRALEERNDSIRRLESDLEFLHQQQAAALREQLELVRWGSLLTRGNEAGSAAPYRAAVESVSPESRFAVIDQGAGAGIRRGDRVLFVRTGARIAGGFVEAVTPDKTVIRVVNPADPPQIGDQVLQDRVAPEADPSNRWKTLQADLDRLAGQDGLSRIEAAWLRRRFLEEADQLPPSRLREWLLRAARRLESTILTLEELEQIRGGFERARRGETAKEADPYEAADLYMKLQALADHCLDISTYAETRFVRQELEKFARHPASKRIRETLGELSDAVGRMTDSSPVKQTLQPVAARLQQISPDDLGR